jgi:hypothetical protein
MLDWDELARPEHAAMLEDVKRMIAVRKREASILALEAGDKEPKLLAIPYQGDIAVPVPYIRWNERAAVLVAANRDAGQDAQLTLQVPLRETGLAGHTHYKVTELWPEGESRSHSEQDLANFACLVKRDKTPGGGLRVFKIEA